MAKGKQMEIPGMQDFQDNHHRDHTQDMETPVGESMTIPDQSLTIPEIMARWAKGLPLGGQDGHFEMDEDEDSWEGMPDLRSMDLAEIQLLKEQNAQEVERLKAEMEKIQEGKKLLEQQRYEKYLENRIGKELLQRQEQKLADDEAKNLNPDE